MKKYILSLILILAIVLGLTSCGFVDDAFKRKSTPNLFPTETDKNNSNPTTTNSTKTSTEKVEGKYKIIFHENGHGTKPSDLSNVDEIPNPLPTMTASGYNFLGWSLSEDSTEAVTSGTKIDKDTELYGIWKKIGYKIIFHENGHGVKPDDLEDESEIPENLPELEEDGYDFIGWAKSEGSRTVVTPGTRISKDLDLYAIWEEETYSVTYDSNGLGDAPEGLTNVTKLPDELPQLIANEYDFLGWSLASDSDTLVEAGIPIDEDITLYAVWKLKTYEVTYDANGHGTAPAKVSNVARIPNPLPQLSESGYTFKGWSKSSLSTKLVTPGEKISENTTLYAIWKKNTYRIIYHNNGRGTAPEETVGVTSLPDQLPSMTYDDYDFLGWGIEKGSTEPVTPGTPISSNVDLYAIWSLKTYTITYDANGHGTAPNETVGATKLPDTLPTIQGVDDFKFVGWSLENDSKELIVSGKKIFKDTTLYAVWIDTATTIDTVTLKNPYAFSSTYAANDLDGSNNTYAGLNKIVYVVKYLNGSEIEVPVDKNMISEEDYLKIQTAGTHEISIDVFDFIQLVTIKTEYYWNIAYYVRGDLIQCYPFPDGSNSNTPSNPADYLDENNHLWTFDKWSESDENVHKHMNIEAIFKEIELFSYNVAINSGTEISVIAEYDNTRVTDYLLRVVDNDTDYEHSRIIYPNDESTVTGLASSKTYKITGTVTFTFNNESYDQEIEEKIVTTALVAPLSSIDYQYDENTISDRAISLDISEYAENSPEGYKLNTVYLVKEDGEIAGEYQYSSEEPIAYFDSLEPSTQYKTYFFYAKTVNLTSYNRGRKNARLNYDYFEKYGFCFVGFYVATRSASSTLREIKMVYNDPSVGQRVLYRYYVENGNDLPYSTNLFNNPWSFALPLSLRGNYAYGDYRDLKGITSNKEVEVILMPMNDYNEAKHTIIFVGSTFDYSGNKSSYEENYRKNEYIIAIVEVNNDEQVQIPTGFIYHIPEDTTKYHYEFKWGTQGITSIKLDENITCSGIVRTSYSELEKLLEPEFYNSGSQFTVGSDFFAYYIWLQNTKSIIQDSVDIYLTEGAMGGTTRVNIKPKGKNQGIFEGLSGKYTFHYDCKYDINDGTGIHTKTLEIPFATYYNGVNSNMTLSSPNTQTVNVTYPYANTNYQYGVILRKASDTEASYDSWTKIRTSYNSKANVVTSITGLNTNTTYHVYSYSKSDCYVYIDGNHNVSQCTTNKSFYEVSYDYKTITTKDGIEPTSFTLEVDYKAGTSRNQHSDGEIRLKFDNCPTYDIGNISIHLFYELPEYTSYGNPMKHMESVTMEYKADAGLYRYAGNLTGIMLYKALFGEFVVSYDSYNHKYNYSYYGYLESIEIYYCFNNNKTAYSYFFGSRDLSGGNIKIEWVAKS